MKILQLTFTYGNNMGAMLQAYALNKVLTDMGNDCYFLPLNNHPFELKKTSTNIKTQILGLLKKYKNRNYTDKWFKEFNSFLYEKCNFAPYLESKSIKTIKDDYDMFLVGSDQVWNAISFKSDYFLLKDIDDSEKKYSYAASLGMYSIRLKNDNLLDEIEKFGGISFREKIDYEDAKRNGLNCRLDLDPTFLVDKSEWEKLTHSKYSFLSNCVCMFGYDKTSFEFAKKYAKAKGMKVVVVNYFGNRFFPGIKIINPPSPVDLLSIIQYSGAIVTHSYHVFVLSLNLNKQVFITKNSGKRANRFDTVIEAFDLKNRETVADNIDGTTDFEKFNDKLYELRCDSLGYLRRITKND